MAFVVFLALKNTPLAFLTAYSYERLNCLHQISGCLTFLMMVLHASCYTSYFASKNKLQILREKEQIAGILSGFAFLSVIFSALVIRRFWYELFYVAHLTFFSVGIVSVCFHQPLLTKKNVIVLSLTAAMWALDRLIRVSRALYNLPHNFATVHPLPSGGTRVVFKKVPARAVPGKHFYIWIPSVRMFEMHPFTIVGTQPLEFIIKAQNGFTRDLHQFALKNPGGALRASLDGPYGTFPDPMEYEKIVLIAGGGGASFTFGLVNNLLEKMKGGSSKSIDFIWTVKQHGMCSGLWSTLLLSLADDGFQTTLRGSHNILRRFTMSQMQESSISRCSSALLLYLMRCLTSCRTIVTTQGEMIQLQKTAAMGATTAPRQ
jgi:predicted ferric reductase